MRLAVFLACLAAPVLAEPVSIPLTAQEVGEGFCLDALKAGRVLAALPDGSLVIEYGAVFYFVSIAPEAVTCEASRYLPNG